MEFYLVWNYDLIRILIGKDLGSVTIYKARIARCSEESTATSKNVAAQQRHTEKESLFEPLRFHRIRFAVQKNWDAAEQILITVINLHSGATDDWWKLN